MLLKMLNVVFCGFVLFFFAVLHSCAQIRGVRSRHRTAGVLRARHLGSHCASPLDRH